MSNQIFRQEVLDAQRTDMFGAVIMAQPPGMRILIIAVLILTAAIGGLLFGFSYTKKIDIRGELVTGLANTLVYAPVDGTVSAAVLKPGKDVSPREVLMKLALPRQAEGDQSPIGVRAPIAGIIQEAHVRDGDTVVHGQILAAISPHGNTLIAQLNVPASAIDFIRIGQAVRVKFQAYPHQRYGYMQGTVTAISPPVLVRLPSDRTGAGHGAEPMYRINVKLAEGTMKVGSRAPALLAGMQVGADMRLETRQLYLWALQPLRDRLVGN